MPPKSPPPPCRDRKPYPNIGRFQNESSACFQRSQRPVNPLPIPRYWSCNNMMFSVAKCSKCGNTKDIIPTKQITKSEWATSNVPCSAIINAHERAHGDDRTAPIDNQRHEGCNCYSCPANISVRGHHTTSQAPQGSGRGSVAVDPADRVPDRDAKLCHQEEQPTVNRVASQHRHSPCDAVVTPPIEKGR